MQTNQERVADHDKNGQLSFSSVWSERNHAWYLTSVPVLPRTSALKSSIVHLSGDVQRKNIAIYHVDRR